MEIVNAYVEAGRTLVLFHRTEAGIARASVPAEWSFFVRAGDLPAELERELRSARTVRGLRREGSWIRISWADEWARRAMLYGRKDPDTGRRSPSPFQERGIEIFEGDVDPVRRWFTDTPDARVAKPRRGYFDLETDSRVPPRLAREGAARILSASLASEDEEVRWVGLLESFDDDAERRLILEFFARARAAGATQLVAWGGENFDFGAIAGRCERLGIREDLRGFLWLDHLKMFARMNLNSSESGEEKQSMSLNSIAQAQLGEGKEEVPPDVAARWPGRSLGSLSWELWEAGGDLRELLARYNLKDTLLMCRIERKTGFAALFDTLADVCKVLPDTSGLLPTKQMDGFMLRLGIERDHRFATKYRKEEDEQDPFAGAFVMEPKATGILRDVHVADFASLYPSVIITWNMSPETKAGTRGAEDVAGIDLAAERLAWSPLTGVCFDTGGEGMLPAALKVMLSLRKEWSKKEASLPPGTPEAKEAKRRSMAYKVAANSFYGVIGASTSRYFDREVAESVTQNSVWLIKRTIAEAEARGMFVFYSDTDSFFAQKATKVGFEDFVAWANADFYPGILREVGCADNRISLAYEKEFSVLAMIMKKRYCNPSEAPIWMADGTFKRLGDVRVGDRVAGWRWGEKKRGTKKRLCSSEVVAVHRHFAPVVKVTMESGRVLRCTSDHQWLRGRRLWNKNRDGSPRLLEWCTARVGQRLCHVVDVPRQLTLEEEREASWLGGIFDGEGSLCSRGRGQITLTQSPRVNPTVCSRIETSLSTLGFPFSILRQNKADDCNRYSLRGGLQTRVNFVAWCRPAKTAKIAPSIFKSRFGSADEIRLVEPDGEDDVIGLTTETGNYVAWGYASKNCGRFAHFKGTAGRPMPAEGEPFDKERHSRPEIKGLEFKRGDAAVLGRRLQERVIMALMRGDHDPRKYRRYLEEALDHVAREELPVEEIQRTQSITKPFAEYHGVDKNGRAKSVPVHVRVAEEIVAKGGEIGEGARVSYVVVDATDGIRAIPAQEYRGECDRYYLWEDVVYPPTQRVLAVCFPRENWRDGFERLRPRGRVLKGQGLLFGGIDPIADAALERERRRRAPSIQEDVLRFDEDDERMAELRAQERRDLEKEPDRWRA